MAKSLRKRFEGNEKQKVQELKVFGWNEFCNLEGVGPDSLQRWFQNQKGCELDSIFNYHSPPASLSDLCGRDRAMLAVQKLISGFEGHISRLEARDKERNELILHLRNQLRRYQQGEFEGYQPIFELCREYARGQPVET